MFGVPELNTLGLPSYTLDSLCTKITDGSHNPPKGIDNSDYYMLSSKNIVDDSITLDDPRYLSKEQWETENKRTQIAPGDVLLTIVGTVGRCAVVPDGHANIALQRSVCVLKPKQELLNSKFLFFELKCMQSYIDSLAQGAAQRGIYLAQVGKLRIVVPDLALQGAFVEMLEQSDKSKFTEHFKSQFIEMLNNSKESNVLGDFIYRVTPKRCGNLDLPVLSVTKERSIVFQNERFEAGVASVNKSNYIVVPRGYIVQGIHIDEGNFGLQTLVDNGIVSPAYKLYEIIGGDIIPELLEYYLRSDKAIDYYRRNYSGTTVARRQVISQEKLMSMPLNVPPINEQKQFFNIMKQSDKSKYVAFQETNFIENLLNYTYNHYFRRKNYVH